VKWIKLKAVLYKNVVTTPLGDMIVVADMVQVYCLVFADQPAIEPRIEKMTQRLGCSLTEGSSPVIESLISELHEYFGGVRTSFSVSLAFAGTCFQQAAWNALQQIPYGAVINYSEQAHAMGRPAAVRAVANANGANMCAIIVPCHRVVKKDGSLCGYNGGVWRKKWLLAHEK
jgi:AraC family transcriptional regulator of adaptative response/methylated-DNA-[protein]-cysteine methyltransferase